MKCHWKKEENIIQIREEKIDIKRMKKKVEKFSIVILNENNTL